MSVTTYQKRYDKEKYIWLKEHHICVWCKKEKAEDGKLYCLVCKMDRREQSKKQKLNKEQKEKKRVYAINRYNKLKNEGICVACGKRKNKENSIFCSICALKRNRRAKNTRAENGVTPRELFGTEGYCSTCGKKTNKYEKLCDRCMENSRRTIRIALEKSLKNTNNYFRKQINAEWRARK